MVRTGRERKLRRKIRFLKEFNSKLDVIKKKADNPIRPVESVFIDEVEGKTVKVSAARMKQSYQGGRPSLKDLVSAGYPTSR